MLIRQLSDVHFHSPSLMPSHEHTRYDARHDAAMFGLYAHDPSFLSYSGGPWGEKRVRAPRQAMCGRPPSRVLLSCALTPTPPHSEWRRGLGGQRPPPRRWRKALGGPDPLPQEVLCLQMYTPPQSDPRPLKSTFPFALSIYYNSSSVDPFSTLLSLAPTVRLELVGQPRPHSCQPRHSFSPMVERSSIKRDMLTPSARIAHSSRFSECLGKRDARR